MPHRKNRLDVQGKFSEILNLSLKNHHGYKPSATHLANEFNLRADGTTTVSRQTALKWMTGKAIPDPGRMMVLAKWLDLDLNEIFK